ncbi:MAG: hypothetical protein P1U56_03605 [Saprospiraceae bacterium]|nr:hypothetical protein [Saprospiraceae bacterium]
MNTSNPDLPMILSSIPTKNNQWVCVVFVVFLLLSITPAVILGQESQIAGLRKDFNNYLYEDLDSAKWVKDKMIDLVKQTSEPNEKAIAFHCAGNYNLVSGQYLNALAEYKKAIEYYRLAGNYKDVSGILINVASCKAELGFLKESMDSHLSSLRLQDSLQIQGYPRATNFINIGILHSELEDSKSALKYLRQAKTIYKELKDSFSMVECDYNISLSLADVDSFDRAQEILFDIIPYFRKERMGNKLARSLLELGTNYRIQKKYDASQEVFQEALKLALEGGDISLPGLAYFKLSNLALDQKNYKQAKNYGQLSFKATQNAQNRRDLIHDYQNLSLISEGEGNYEEALEYYRQYAILKDSILGEEKLKMIANLEAIYESEKKENELLLLKEKSQRNALEKKMILGLFFALFLIACLLFYLLKLRLDKQKVAKEKTEQELSFTKDSLDRQEKELSVYTLQLASQNKFLNGLKENILDIKVGDNGKRQVRTIVNSIDIKQQNESYWEQFRDRFTQVHKNFESEVKKKYPMLTSNDIRLMMLLKMNLSSKEIANILCISYDGIKKSRYRLRKKIGLSNEESLQTLVLGIG